jgi:hypothetical protein
MNEANSFWCDIDNQPTVAPTPSLTDKTPAQPTPPDTVSDGSQQRTCK